MSSRDARDEIGLIFGWWRELGENIPNPKNIKKFIEKHKLQK